MSWFDALTGSERALFEPRFLRRTFQRDDTIVAQGDSSISVGLVQTGHAAVKVATPRGASVTVTVLGPRSSFGEIAEITRKGRTATLVALDDVTVRLLPGGVFEELRHRNPGIDRALLVSLAARLDDLSAQLAASAYETVESRTERRLAELAESFVEPGGSSASIPLTQDDIAGIVGAARPTVREVLAALVDEGLISTTPDRVDVPDVEALRQHGS